MGYIHLTITERASIEILRKENYSLRAIANRLNRSVPTISREIKRNKSKHNYVLIYHSYKLFGSVAKLNL